MRADSGAGPDRNRRVRDFAAADRRSRAGRRGSAGARGAIPRDQRLGLDGQHELVDRCAAVGVVRRRHGQRRPGDEARSPWQRVERSDSGRVGPVESPVGAGPRRAVGLRAGIAGRERPDGADPIDVGRVVEPQEPESRRQRADWADSCHLAQLGQPGVPESRQKRPDGADPGLAGRLDQPGVTVSLRQRIVWADPPVGRQPDEPQDPEHQRQRVDRHDSYGHR